uniref:Uncharacterized protein n=1 Tax=Caenorhabditis japonica TaxID=281687 RepID=A0A8R1HKY9_CAEJA
MWNLSPRSLQLREFFVGTSSTNAGNAFLKLFPQVLNGIEVGALAGRLHYDHTTMNTGENPKPTRYPSLAPCPKKLPDIIEECEKLTLVEPETLKEEEEEKENQVESSPDESTIARTYEKFEPSELSEYRDHTWCIAAWIDREKTSDKANYQYLVYSYQYGIDRIVLTPEQTTNWNNSLLIKYRKSQTGNMDMEVLPIYSSIPSTGLMSLRYRYNKGVEFRVYGIVNFVDVRKDPNALNQKTMVWTDALGPLYLTAADRSNIRRQSLTTEEETFAPLRMCQMTVKANFKLSIANGVVPNWSVVNFHPLMEEAKGSNIGRNLWPARVYRFDDLRVIKSTVNNEYWLRSVSDPNVTVFAGAHLHGILNSGGWKYTNFGVMMAIVVPVFIQNQFAYFEAMIAGPYRVVMIITEGRCLNFTPKTLAPSVEKMCEKHRRDHELKILPRPDPKWNPKGLQQMTSLRGFKEFEFQWKNLPGYELNF